MWINNDIFYCKSHDNNYKILENSGLFMINIRVVDMEKARTVMVAELKNT